MSLKLTKYGLGCILGDFFLKKHLVTLVVAEPLFQVYSFSIFRV
jgi:hypothetical protein